MAHNNAFNIVNEARHIPGRGRYCNTVVIDDANGITYLYDGCGNYAIICDKGEQNICAKLKELVAGEYSDTDLFAAIKDDGSCKLVSLPEETITTLTVAGNVITYVNEAGVVSSFNINEIDMDFNALADNGDGSFTFTTEDGTTVDLDVCQTVIDHCGATAVANPDGSYTVTGNDGNSITIAGPTDPSVITQVVTAGHLIATHDDNAGTITDIIESLTTLVDNGGSFTYTSEDGTQTIVNLVSTAAGNLITHNVDGVFIDCPAIAGCFTSNDSSVTITSNADGTVNLAVTPLDIHQEISNFGVGTIASFVGIDANGNCVTEDAEIPVETETEITYGTAADGGDEYVNESGAKFRVNPRTYCEEIPIPGASANNNDTTPVNIITTSYTRQYANSVVVVDINLVAAASGQRRTDETTTTAPPANIADGVVWGASWNATVGGNTKRIVRNNFNSIESAHDATDTIRIPNNSAASFCVPEGSGAVDIEAEMLWDFVPFYTSGTNADLSVYGLRLYGDSCITITEYEVL